MRRILAVFFLMVILLSLAGCSSKKVEQPAGRIPPKANVSLELPQTREELDDATFSGKVKEVAKEEKAFLVAVEHTPGKHKDMVNREMWYYAVPETQWQRGDTAVVGTDCFGELEPGVHVDLLARENVALAVHFVPEQAVPPGSGNGNENTEEAPEQEGDGQPKN